jgi:hypothetical protein
VRPLQQLIEHPQLVHHLEGRRVDRVASEIAQKVGMLFEDDDLNPGPGQQEPQDQARGAASDHTTLAMTLIRRSTR